MALIFIVNHKTRADIKSEKRQERDLVLKKVERFEIHYSGNVIERLLEVTKGLPEQHGEQS